MVVPHGTSFHSTPIPSGLPRSTLVGLEKILCRRIRSESRAQMSALYFGSAIFSTSAMVGPSRQKARWARHSKTSI
jgi:hypothetical protein